MIPVVSRNTNYKMSEERRQMIGKVQFKKKKKKETERIPVKQPGLGNHIDTYV